jgi:hypothetical protein
MLELRVDCLKVDGFKLQKNFLAKKKRKTNECAIFTGKIR